MSHARVVVVTALALAACSCPAPPAAPAAAAAPAVGACDDLAWLDATRALRVTEISQGHLGLWEFHADLARREGAYVGVVMATHRVRPGAPTRTASREVQIDAEDIAALFAAFRGGVKAPPDRGDAKHTFVEDSSRSTSLFVDATAPSHHAQIYVDEAQREPQAWRVRGCDRAFAYDATKTITSVFKAFAVRLERDALFASLTGAD